MRIPSVTPPLNGNVLAGDDLVVAEWNDEGGLHETPFLIAPPHIHLEDEEAWYVLEGKLCVQIDDAVHEVGVGAGILVPKGAKHTYWNPGPEPARYLLIMPRNVYSLIQAIHDPQIRSEKTLTEIFELHQAQLL